jgi:hypothetical protein
MKIRSEGFKRSCLTVGMAVLLMGTAVTAAAADQELTGRVVRVVPGGKRVILNVPDGQSAEGKQVTVSVDRQTSFVGVERISDLREGSPVHVEVKKSWYGNKWTIRRLIYNPPVAPAGMSPTDKSQLHEMENRFAHGQMGDIEFETKRQAFEDKQNQASKTI